LRCSVGYIVFRSQRSFKSGCFCSSRWLLIAWEWFSADYFTCVVSFFFFFVSFWYIWGNGDWTCNLPLDSIFVLFVNDHVLFMGLNFMLECCCGDFETLYLVLKILFYFSIGIEWWKRLDYFVMISFGLYSCKCSSNCKLFDNVIS